MLVEMTHSMIFMCRYCFAVTRSLTVLVALDARTPEYFINNIGIYRK